MELMPTQAASLAEDVYALTKYSKLDEAIIFLSSKYKSAFSFNGNNIIKGKTGGPGAIKCKTAFGFTLLGQGAYAGQEFIIFRGTQYLADWLTNLNSRS